MQIIDDRGVKTPRLGGAPDAGDADLGILMFGCASILSASQTDLPQMAVSRQQFRLYHSSDIEIYRLGETCPRK